MRTSWAGIYISYRGCTEAMRFSLRNFLLLSICVSAVLGYSIHRYTAAKNVKMATKEIWNLDCQTSINNEHSFSSDHFQCESTPGELFNSLFVSKCPDEILVPEQPIDQTIDEIWLQRFKNAIKRLPQVRTILIERTDFTDKMLNSMNQEFSEIEIRRFTTVRLGDATRNSDGNTQPEMPR